MSGDNVFADPVIEVADSGRVSARIPCPSCGPDRKKSGEKTLSITLEDGQALYYCHHCDASGRVDLSAPAPALSLAPPAVVKTLPLTPEHIAWLEKERGISGETAESCGAFSGEAYIRSRGGKFLCVGFPYKNEDGTEAVKWRDAAKNFTQTGSARSLWRIEQFSGGDLVICEGEFDAMAFAEAGIFATSVPNGAPSREVMGDDAKKFSYLWGKSVEGADKIILATDADGPGGILAEEIARRVGKARCWRVRYPEGCKDANDTLKKSGTQALLDCLTNATPWPISGLRDPGEYREEALALYNGGFRNGIGSGVKSIDKLYRVLPQTLTICTGVPGSGKSAFLTWLAAGLAKRNSWNCAVLSAETSSQIHMLQMASAYVGQPYRGPNKMSEEELNRGLDWVEKRFVFIDECDTDINSVLDRAHAAVLRNGVRLLLVDPYNFLTGNVNGVTSEPSSVAHINSLLVALKVFAVEKGVAVFLCAHPTKMYRQSNGSVPVPTGYDVAGSSAFYNVADSGITISRLENNETLVTCWKARFPWIGSPGEATVKFDPDVGSYSEIKYGWEDIEI